MNSILEFYQKQKEEKFPLLSLLSLIENIHTGHQDAFPYTDMNALVEWLKPIAIPQGKERSLKPSESTRVYNMLAWVLKCPESTIFDERRKRNGNG